MPAAAEPPVARRVYPVARRAYPVARPAYRERERFERDELDFFVGLVMKVAL